MKSKNIVVIITGALIVFVIAMSLLSSGSSGNNEEEKNGDSKVEDIVFEDGKVNIYFFKGDGCPHCEEEIEFLESIEEEYGEYFNLYSFEVWYNKDNAELMKKLAEKMEIKITGVPLTIIGEKHFSGFSSTMEEDFKKAIMEQSQNSFDVYKE